MRAGPDPCRVAGGGAGFTLSEVLVGLLVLEVGILGVAGLSLVAVRELSSAASITRAAAAAEAVWDSLASFGAEGYGRRSFRGGLVLWELTEATSGGREAGAGGAEAKISALDSAGDTLFALHGWVPAPRRVTDP